MTRRIQQLVLGLVMMWCSSATAQQWLADANTRIELNRKSDLTIHVVDQLGNSVSGADVHVQMKRHHFRFGTAVTASWINDTSANGIIYRLKLLENFNEVVLENDLKWPSWDGLWGPSFNWPNTSQALDWLDEKKLPTRGHYLSWATWSGVDAYGTNDEVDNVPQSVIDSTPQRLFDHITAKVQTVNNRAYEWDVINHPVGWLNDTYENRFGLKLYSDILNHARAEAPAGMPMWINEDDVISGGSKADDYERIIRDMINRGAAPDGIGFQAHFVEEWGRLTPANSAPQQVYDRIDRFDEIIDRLRVTEFDIDVGEDEQRQAKLMHDFLTVMFSHPAMEAITMWGFWQDAHWRPNAALYRSDWSEKPAATAYRDLVFGDWWTDDRGASDNKGEYAVRAFKGLYDIRVTAEGKDYVVADFLLDGNDSINVVVDVGLAGDFNRDNHVDAADYTVWRAGLGSTYTQADYDKWKSNFGKTLGAGTRVFVVPEPTSLMLTEIAVIVCAQGLRASRVPPSCHSDRTDVGPRIAP